MLRMRLDRKTTKSLLHCFEVVFDPAVAVKPICPDPFRWPIGAYENPVTHTLASLPIDEELFLKVLNTRDLDIPNQLSELAYYLYQLAMCSNKRVCKRIKSTARLVCCPSLACD